MLEQADNKINHFAGVALLITHYNRSVSLERLLKTFANQGWVFDEIIVSDDGSIAEHQKHLQYLQKIYGFKFVTAPVNKGLGNNLNKGEDAVTAPYTLYVQEDFEPTTIFPLHFANAVTILNENPDIDIARFFAYFKYPYLQPYKNGFSQMRFGFWKAGYRKFFCYSDHPHLRRSSFFEKFGRYKEGVSGDQTEYKMMMSFLKHKGKAIYFDNYRDLFSHINSVPEPSTMQRKKNWRQSKKTFIKRLRDFYRHIRYYKDYLFQ